jgi:redox-sensitive bicupin YhaK (pirin superfamily)
LIRVIGGTLISNDAEYQSPGNRITESPLSILDLSLPPHKKCIFQVPSGASVCLYIRRGSCVNINASDKSIIDVKLCNLMTFTASEISSPESNVVIEAGSTGLEALFLVGQKLNEPVITNGPLVQADERMMESSARSFNALGPGSFWDYKLSDDEWMNHIQKLNLQGLILATRPELS